MEEISAHPRSLSSSHHKIYYYLDISPNDYVKIIHLSTNYIFCTIFKAL